MRHIGEMLRRASAPVVKGRADQLPIRNDSVDAAAALYHLDDPLVAIKEAARVIRRGGLVAVCAPSHHDSPEFAVHPPPKAPST